MSALGQERTSRDLRSIPLFPPKGGQTFGDTISTDITSHNGDMEPC